jgi:hypothetical protein
MSSRNERRAAAFESIAAALLELAAVEREPYEANPQEVLINRRNCAKELSLTPSAFVAAAGRDFPAFRVSRTLTATKADVLTWLKTRAVQPKLQRPKPAPTAPDDRDVFLKSVHACFVARVGRPMTDDELDNADIWICAGRDYATLVGRTYDETADQVAAKTQSKIGIEPRRHAEWRSLGLDVTAMERDATKLREELQSRHPEMDWRDRVRAVSEMWDKITSPLLEARRVAQKLKRDAKKGEREKTRRLVSRSSS